LFHDNRLFRTYEELKHICFVRIKELGYARLFRTYEELKLVFINKCHHSESGLFRTYEELKPFFPQRNKEYNHCLFRTYEELKQIFREKITMKNREFIPYL